MFSQLLCWFNEGSISLKPLYSDAFFDIHYSSLTFSSISSPGRQLLKDSCRTGSFFSHENSYC